MLMVKGKKCLKNTMKKACGRKDAKDFIIEDNSNGCAIGLVNHGPQGSSFAMNEDKGGAGSSITRKHVDPGTSKYFSEIANLLENDGVDFEERSVVCGSALEETRGNEFLLATDYIISHTLQTLIEGCDVDHLCGFVNGCADVFPLIAMDRSGSHVAESALKSLATHLEEAESYSLIEDTLTVICKAIVVAPMEMIRNCHGSHVLRRLLCLCGGVPLESPEFQGRKSSQFLAKRLNLSDDTTRKNESSSLHQGCPHLLKYIISEMLKSARDDIKTLLINQYGSLVLQTMLKLIPGHDEELCQIIAILLLSGKKENQVDGSFIDEMVVCDILKMIRETAYSHLMEVMLEVAPQSLFDEMLNKVFQGSLFDLSSHHCGNFVVQSLVCYARKQEQIKLVWEELGTKFSDLLGMEKAGVIASLIAACQRLSTNEYECIHSLSAAVCLPDESPNSIVPRIMFLGSYFSCNDKPNWAWPDHAKIHIIGSLILQAVLNFDIEFIRPYIVSMASIEAEQVLQTASDPCGTHVIEAFLGSGASAKQKIKLIRKLKGKFGELAMHSSSSFTIEKCFTASSVALREAIMVDLVAVREDLSKTKHGPYLLRKLDFDGYARWPDQWRSKQESKQSAYREFCSAFGTGKIRSSKAVSFLSSTSKNRVRRNQMKKMRNDMDAQLENVVKLKRKNTSNTTTTPIVNQTPFLSMNIKKKLRT